MGKAVLHIYLKPWRAIPKGMGRMIDIDVSPKI
jgi:hypothetical protein